MIDRISSFGYISAECMKVGTIPIALKPDIILEYLIERNEAGDAVKLRRVVEFGEENAPEPEVVYVYDFLRIIHGKRYNHTNQKH